MSVNERVRSVRYALGLTQEKFAKKISISTSYLAGIETRVRDVNKRTIRLIGDAFNANEHWLETGDGEMFNNDVNAALAKMTNYFKSLSPQSQICVLKQIDALLKLEQSFRST